MKRIIKMIFIILIILTLTMYFQILTNKVYGTTIIEDPDEYKVEMSSEEDTIEMGNIIATIIRNIGIVVAVIALMIIGLRAMVGSAEQKADYKKSLPGYVLGAFMVVAISCIPSIIYSVVSSW